MFCLVTMDYIERVKIQQRNWIGRSEGTEVDFTAMDIICRKKRMQGYNVLFPIGFDAFGLPTENYAIKNHVHGGEGTGVAHMEALTGGIGELDEAVELLPGLVPGDGGEGLFLQPLLLPFLFNGCKIVLHG